MNETRDRPSAFALNLRLLRFSKPSDFEPDRPVVYKTQLWHINHFLDQLYKAATPMAKQQSAARNTFTPTTFINLRLDDQQTKLFHGWQKELGEALVDEVAITLAEAGKLSVSWDDANKCFIAAVTNKDSKSPNCDCCVSSRSQDWYEAVALTVFKVRVLLKDKDWSSAGTNSNWG